MLELRSLTVAGKFLFHIAFLVCIHFSRSVCYEAHLRLKGGGGQDLPPRSSSWRRCGFYYKSEKPENNKFYSVFFVFSSYDQLYSKYVHCFHFKTQISLRRQIFGPSGLPFICRCGQGGDSSGAPCPGCHSTAHPLCVPLRVAHHCYCFEREKKEKVVIMHHWCLCNIHYWCIFISNSWFQILSAFEISVSSKVAVFVCGSHNCVVI